MLVLLSETCGLLAFAPCLVCRDIRSGPTEWRARFIFTAAPSEGSGSCSTRHATSQECDSPRGGIRSAILFTGNGRPLGNADRRCRPAPMSRLDAVACLIVQGGIPSA